MSPSVYVERRKTGRGSSYRVRYRLGGRESGLLYGGSFRIKGDADARARWISGEIAAMRVPDLPALAEEPPAVVALRVAALRWRESRIDVAPATRETLRKSIAHAVTTFGDRDPATLTSQEIATWVGELAERLAPGTVEKALGALRQLLDHVGVEPNPARDRRVRLPRQRREEIEPPTAAEVEAILSVVARRYRLPLVVLEATAMRVGELERLRWGDVDVAGGRWRVARQHEKAGRGRWINVPPDVFAAVDALVPREDRDLEAAIFNGVEQGALRREMARSCKAAGIPLYSPHDLRHRRISLWHHQGISWAQIGAWAGQASKLVTADTYTHVLVDGHEVERFRALG
jgi:integrase